MPYLERLAEDGKLVALGFCGESGAMQYSTRAAPRDLDCSKLPLEQSEAFATLRADGNRYLVSVFPISAAGTKGHVILLHDLSFIDARAREAGLYVGLALFGVAAGLGLLALAIVLGLQRGWLRAIRAQIEEARVRPDFPAAAAGGHVLQPRASLVAERCERGAALRRRHQGGMVPGHAQAIAGGGAAWNPGARRLQPRALHPQLRGRRDRLADSRERPGRRARAGHARLRRHLDRARQRRRRPRNRRRAATASPCRPSDPAYTLRRVWLTEEEQDGYYYGFANEGLWPLCHIAFVRPDVPRRGLAALLAGQRALRRRGGRGGDAATIPIVLVQDYHFALLPRMIRERLPDATIVTFWHIPWPNAETFGICPWREEILDGLLGSTILGFHTQFHCNNFLETVDRFIESRIDREHVSVTLGGHETMVRPYPISIEWPPAALADRKPPVAECRALVRERFGLPPTPSCSASASSGSTTPRASSTACARSTICSSRQPRWKGTLRLHSGRRADAQQARQLQRAAGRGPSGSPTTSMRATATATTSRSS